MPTEQAVSDRVTVPKDEAIAMLPDGEYVHTFLNPAAGMMIGADWTRADIEAAFEQHPPELTGENATRMGHGLCFWDGAKFVFVATKKEETK